MSGDGSRAYGTLFIVATPIGHLGDMTFRAVETLKRADLVACEDTRTSGVLLAHYDIATRRVPYHEHNAAVQRPRLLEMLEEGKTVALISDAGTPLISDPGYKLVREAQERGIPVAAVPGPSSLTAALSIGGLPTDRFLFAGFLPPKSAARRRALHELGAVRATLVLFESAQRIEGLLADIAETLGAREVALCRELTKRFEEVRRGDIPALLAQLAEKPAKGELVVLVAPPDEPSLPSEEDTEALLREALATMRTKDAARAVAERTGLPRQPLYELALKLQADDAAHE